jgi:hypothetical protein
MPSRSMDARIPIFLLVCGVALAGAGCARKSVQASVPVLAAPLPPITDAERPMNTAPDTAALPPVQEPANPPVVEVTPAPPPDLSIPEPKPAPPRKPAQEPAVGAAAGPAHPPAPQISPQLSAGDQASYERKTGEDIAAAEKNLRSASGKQLNAAQQDLVDKIRSFLTQSRDASKGGDWARAQNLAQKARLLSSELVNSL